MKEAKDDDSSHHRMIWIRSVFKKFLVVFKLEHVLCKILGDERKYLGSLCEKYEKIQGNIVVLRWSNNHLIKDCMSKFFVVFHLSLSYDMMSRNVVILLRDITEKHRFTWSRVDCVQTKFSTPRTRIPCWLWRTWKKCTNGSKDLWHSLLGTSYL